MTGQVHDRLGEWLDGLSMPPLDDPRRRIEELRLDQLRNFLLLLLAREPEALAAGPAEALRRWAPDLVELESYCAKLTLPLQGTPDDIVSVLKLGHPQGELFALQARMMDELGEDGRRLIVELGKLF